MELFADGTKIVFVIPVSRGDPERALRRALRKVCGKNSRILDPVADVLEYRKAMDQLRARLQKGEHVVCWDWKEVRVSFNTPSRRQKAWSAWIRIVDISSSLYN
jgi:hypothetical protein